ncbi:MAG TPA: hypothetical protein VI540_07125 [Gaiellaceae bacterium]|nr:hypothetical protein [Gaiellaceae bacterium]
MPGPHVFGDGRLGCWFTSSPNFADKLRHRLPLVKTLGVSDAFLPREATLADKQLVRDAELFAALYETPPAGMAAKAYGEQAVADCNRLSLGACELNIEDVADDKLAAFVRAAVHAVRAAKPALRLRVNVVPFKGTFLPADLFASDAQLYVIVQNYLGNMDARVACDEIVRDLVDHGIPWPKVSVMYGAHVGDRGGPRVPALPQIRWRGSIYQDDLLADAGYLG